MQNRIISLAALITVGIMALALGWFAHAAVPLAAEGIVVEGRATLFAAPAPTAPRAQPQMSSASYTLDWSAAGEISGGASTSASYKLNATIGQMAANTSSVSTSYGLCTGFECVANVLSLYLPLIRR